MKSSTLESPDAAAAALLQEVDALARELDRGRRRAATLESGLDKDLGIDSLGRVELLVRLEKRFGVTLPDASVAGAETVSDLLRALGRAVPASAPVSAAPAAAAPATDAGGAAPESSATLLDALEWHVAKHPGRVHIALQLENGGHDDISYADLLKESEEVAAGLHELGLEPGRPVALMLPTSRDYFKAFFGVMRAGGIPVPLYPPHRASQIEEHVRRQAGILASARVGVMITSDEVRKAGRLVQAQVPELRHVVTVPDLTRPGATVPRIRLKASDVAFLQYTSGSTGTPKGVVLTHGNLLANIRSMSEASRAENEVFVSWLPLYHDMGLIGAWLGSLTLGMRAVLMSPLMFLARPTRWLHAISRERGTISAAPNFAYDLCARKIPEADLEGLDLSAWRLALNGAEMIHPDTLDRFCERFAKYGFRRESMFPVYGLAECSLGLAFPPLGRGPKIDAIRRSDFADKGLATPVAADESGVLRFASCGRPLPGHEVRIVDEAGREVHERECGRLQFRGPSTTSGYYRNPEATRELFDGPWVKSGDTAYVAEGEIFLVGRTKDLIIRGGRNIHPQELEEAVGRVPGIRLGCVAVFGTADPATGTEKLIVLAETREQDPDARAKLVDAIQEAAVGLLGTGAEEVVLAPPRTVLKTPSGKIRRSACRELYERGTLLKPASVGVQVARLVASSVKPTLRRARQGMAGALYALWIRVFLILSAIPAVPITLLLPALSWRRAFVRLWSRATLAFAGIRLDVTGRDALSGEGPCVVVANHASYLDAVVLIAVLPSRFSFVAKREFTQSWFARLFMSRLGTLFVDRFDPEKGVEDAGAAAEAVRQGRSLAVFPEGTFGRAPGLRPFRLGAFMVAAQASAPVLPVALRGTRSILRDEQWFPRRGAVGVTLGRPIAPAGGDWTSALALRDAARREILRACGEPDLTGDDSGKA
ncbi:MAG TPA: AMP-binding protein [Planctomycetota bacterium]